MNFKGHLIIGTLVGLILGILATAFFKLTLKLQIQITTLIIIFSILPDIDTNSIPRKWFYRLIFAILFYCAITSQYEMATMIGLISLTPLLSSHRGWTHSIWSALFAPFCLILIYAFLTSTYSFKMNFYEFFGFEHLEFLFFKYIWIIASSSAGWLTHLCIDYRKHI